MRTQEKVELLYEQGEYERAHFIYRNELAPIGDKYAQYMIGFMYLTGTGVNEDPILASAWYRLAAERGFPQFLSVRDELMRSFSDVDVVRSDNIYLQLRQQYSDVVLLYHLLSEDLDSMSARTGSRLPGASGRGNSPVTIVTPGAGTSLSGDEYFRRINNRIRTRAEFLGKYLGADAISADPDDIDLERLEVLVNNYVAKIADR